MCVDNLTVMDMIDEGYGYQDYLARIALKAGVPAVDVSRMASLHAAEHFHLEDQIGSITPGRIADILLMKSPDVFPPEIVIANGRVVAERGRLTVDIPAPNFPKFYRQSIQLQKVKRESFSVRAPQDATRVKARVLEVMDGDAFNTATNVELEVVDGAVASDVSRDILRIAVVERYGRHGKVGLGFVKGFGLKRGGMATSLSIPSNNIVAVGVTEDDLWQAVQHLGKIQGGFALLADGEVLAEVAMPFGGIMADAPFETVVREIKRGQAAARALGCPLLHPFFTMAQTVLSTLPDLGVTDQGLVNSREGRTVPVLVEQAA
jgi:adenine deaminase